jgi:hypothetical protein
MLIRVGIQSVTRIELTISNIVGVAGTANPGEFAILNERGEMTVCKSGR